jgi:apolipoprotein D and lipocalin family protein
MRITQFVRIVFSFPLFCFFFFGCSVPKEMNTESIPAVRSFDLQRYLGTWYEVARLPHSFENGLDKVTATYSLRENNMVEVINKGFNTAKGEWKEAKGKARFKNEIPGALLEVSFFWIFYADYKIIELDTINYSYAMITSGSKEYLWILSRTPQLDNAVYDSLLRKATNWGFNLSALYKLSQ